MESLMSCTQVSLLGMQKILHNNRPETSPTSSLTSLDQYATLIPCATNRCVVVVAFPSSPQKRKSDQTFERHPYSLPPETCLVPARNHTSRSEYSLIVSVSQLLNSFSSSSASATFVSTVCIAPNGSFSIVAFNKFLIASCPSGLG